MHLKQEVSRIEEERIQVLNNVEEVEQKIKDLDNQMEESIREVCSARHGIVNGAARMLGVLMFVSVGVNVDVCVFMSWNSLWS